MNGIGQPERAMQNRVMAMLHDEPRYRFLGDWSDRPSNCWRKSLQIQGRLVTLPCE